MVKEKGRRLYGREIEADRGSPLKVGAQTGGALNKGEDIHIWVGAVLNWVNQSWFGPGDDFV